MVKRSGVQSKTKQKKAQKSQSMENYQEDIDDEYVATESEYVEEEDEVISPPQKSRMGDQLSMEERARMEYEMQDEALEDLEDHADVSSIEPEESELDSDAPEYGREGAPDMVDLEDELEITEGFDESILEMDREEAMAGLEDSNLLDAWYSEFADESTAALVRQQPSLSQTTAEVVIGKDDRIQISNTKVYPWRTICSLRITAKDGSAWIGTGWLVGPRTLITAGHCVYMHKRGGWVQNIKVMPGRNGATLPFGHCMAYSFRSVTGWTKKKKRSHDYGAIILPKNHSYGNQLGYFGYANLSFFSLLGLKVNLSGYPGDKPSGTQWWHARRIKFVTSRTLVYNIDTAGGQSGSPVWRLKNGKRHAVGIHTNGSSLGNSATRITKPVFNNIKAWKYI